MCYSFFLIVQNWLDKWVIKTSSLNCQERARQYGTLFPNHTQSEADSPPWQQFPSSTLIVTAASLCRWAHAPGIWTQLFSSSQQSSPRPVTGSPAHPPESRGDLHRQYYNDSYLADRIKSMLDAYVSCASRMWPVSRKTWYRRLLVPTQNAF